jgi:SAM-dependent methyltransferase
VIARRSPLTAIIMEALPHAGPILEAGCGLGQYVLLLREHGWRVAGADWAIEALAACRRVAPAPLAAMKLDALAVQDGALAGYVSLGVVEHDPNGPDAILAAAHRALAPGGVLVVSVPYVNGVRRLAAPWLRRRGRALARRGEPFYQYLFTRSELAQTLVRHGFRPTSTTPYDPARLLRRALPGAIARRLARASAVPPSSGAGGARPAMPALGAGLRGFARRLLYTPPALRLFGHMLLVVARKT